MPKHTLMAHQVDGVKFIESMNGVAALLWEPGVGKTGTTAAWLDRLASAQGDVRVLVVSPLSAADTWVLQPPDFMDSAVKARMLEGSTVSILTKIKQARNWAAVPDTKIKSDHVGPLGVSGNRVTVMSMSAGAVSSFCKKRPQTIQMLQAIRKYAPHVIVMDESHIIKAHDSNISVAMYQIGQLVPHRIILTGTVNPKDELDCYGQWRFLAPWTFSDQASQPFTREPHKMTRLQAASIRPWPWGRFSDRYATKGGYKGKTAGGGGMREDMEDELRDKIAERSMVVYKADALDLPPTRDVDVHVHLSDAERKAYNEMHDDLAAELANGEMLEAVNALAKIMKLRQIHAGFIRDTELDETHIIGDSLIRTVADVATNQLASEQRLVVFAYFKSECARLAESLKKIEKSTTVEVITGATKAKDRLAIRQRFKDVSGNPERTILVAQARTMSLSVNELVTAQNAIYASPSERRDDIVQSRGRLDRQGQTAPVTFWRCFAPDTISEIMLNRHEQRGSLEKALLDHIRSSKRL